MPATDFSEMAVEIHDQFDAAGASVPDSERDIAEMLATLVDDSQGKREETKSSDQYRFLEETGLDVETFFVGGSTTLDVGCVEEADVWGNLEVKYLRLWNVDHESIAQKGLVGDESGTTIFTAVHIQKLLPDTDLLRIGRRQPTLRSNPRSLIWFWRSAEYRAHVQQ